VFALSVFKFDKLITAVRTLTYYCKYGQDINESEYIFSKSFGLEKQKVKGQVKSLSLRLQIKLVLL